MRNVKSILTAAGNLKQRNGDEDEDILCLRAINDCNLPKFVTADLPLFQWITSDLFDVNLPLPSYGPLFAALDAQALAQNIQLNDYLRVKITQLYFAQTSPAFMHFLLHTWNSGCIGSGCDLLCRVHVPRVGALRAGMRRSLSATA